MENSQPVPATIVGRGPRGSYLPRARTPPDRRMADLSDRELAIYDAIVAFKTDNDGNSPTTRDLSQATGISSSSLVWNYLKGIERAGYITIAKGSRNIRVRGGSWSMPPDPATPISVEEELDRR